MTFSMTYISKVPELQTCVMIYYILFPFFVEICPYRLHSSITRGGNALVSECGEWKRMCGFPAAL